MKIAFLGDSITEGCGASAKEKNYVSLVGKKFGCEVLNYGLGGTRIARQIEYHDDYPIFFDWTFLQRAEIMQSAVDFVFVFGGTNDFGHGDAPFGDPDGSDSATFTGALKRLAAYLSEKYGTDKLCFVTPLRRYEEERGGKKLADYVEAIRKTSAEYGVDIIDFYADGPARPETAENAGYFADGLHPNDRGHEFIADKICEYLRQKIIE